MKPPRITGSCSGCGVDLSETNIEIAKSMIQNYYNVTKIKEVILTRNNKLIIRSAHEAEALQVIFPDYKVIEYDFC